MPAASLPPNLTTRPLTIADSRAVWELMAAQELHDIGSVEIEEADLIGDWQRPSTDLATDSIAVLDGDLIVGYAELSGKDRYDAAVLPSHRGRGIGTWLAAWVRELGRSRGASIVGMPVPAGSAGDVLLESLGYHVRWTSWVLKLGEGETIADRPLPEGYGLREATDADREQVWTVVEDAFLEWSDRDRQTFDDFTAQVWDRPGFEPWHLQVVTDPAGDVAGAAILWNSAGADGRADTYVSRLAVAREHRNRGLAQSLLVAAFAAGRAHGAVTSSLATDSRTGALSLYEKVGMRPDSTWVNRAIAL